MAAAGTQSGLSWVYQAEIINSQISQWLAFHLSGPFALKPKTRFLQTYWTSRMFSSGDSVSLGSPDQAEEPSTLIAYGNAGSNGKAFRGNGFFGHVSIYKWSRRG